LIIGYSTRRQKSLLAGDGTNATTLIIFAISKRKKNKKTVTKALRGDSWAQDININLIQ
jgi:hypothetical protein